MQNSPNRPTIPSIQQEIGTKSIEAFQNNSLRPIIKQLHSQLLSHFSILISKKKGQYFKIAEDQKDAYIHSIFKTEQRYKSELKGMILGNFTREEFEIYTQIAAQVDKRIYSIVEERILTNQSAILDLNLLKHK
jgi:hypothetical protein